MADCQVCGNEIYGDSLSCRFCGSELSKDLLSGAQGFIHKTVNLEQGRPVVEVALQKLNDAIEDAVTQNISVLTLIHGYGSSGKGGLIRLECRKILGYMKSKGTIRDYIAGEEFSRKSGFVKFHLQRYPALVKNKNLNKGNRGVTLVIL
ncbi:MAG: Smr/MutS family protein [Deltaproteobacteria bacterium]|nr:Smr/MutS family protein [Deltaproteobacteria bacterium]